MTKYTQPSEEDLKPLLKKARSITVRAGEPNPPQAVALFDPETGELLSGPRRVEAHSRMQWSQDGIQVKGAGAFCNYDDLRQSWRHSAEERERYEEEMDV